jgi:DNA mismatch endonuclease (patch repair protein)
MTDTFDAETRSRIMRKVRSENTGPEMKVRSLLHKIGFRFRLHRADLPGKPDIVLPCHRVALFVHGCFFHAHNCPRGRREPKANSEYWRLKRQRNEERDARSVASLMNSGWKPIVVWECELRDMLALASRMKSEIGVKPTDYPKSRS